MGETSLYHRDFVRWSAEQAEAIRAAARAGSNLPLDWENIAEEIESLGRSDRRKLGSRASTIIEHLLKLAFSSAGAPRAGWIDTVLRSRSEVERVLEDSPSLRRELPDIVAAEEARAGRAALRALTTAGEPAAAARAREKIGHHTAEEVFGDWLPDGPRMAGQDTEPGS